MAFEAFRAGPTMARTRGGGAVPTCVTPTGRVLLLIGLHFPRVVHETDSVRRPGGAPVLLLRVH